jgi:hypothetical protein
MADWKCPDCGWVNREFSERCLSCGHARDAAMEPVEPGTRPADPGSWGTPWTAPSAQQAVDHAPATARSWDVQSTPAPPPDFIRAEAVPDLPPDPPLSWFSTKGLGGGALVAAGAALITTVIWYLVVAVSSYQIGFIATLVGWVIGTGAVIGARGRGSLWLSGIAAVLTIVSLGVSEYLINYHIATEMVGVQLDLLQPIDFMFSIVVESITADPVTLLFWAFAIGAAAYVPFKAIKPAVEPSAPVGVPV